MDEINCEFNPGDHLTDEQAMRLAMAQAKKGAGFVSPNPQVGCVILDSHNRLISTGYHEKFGGPHAEVNALKSLDLQQLEQARVFVTLEPCAHQGKTPSCAKALAQLPIAEVIYGLVDPNPLVAGQGAKIIEQAGIRTTCMSVSNPALREKLEETCEHFLKNFRSKKIFVSLKVASSLDGQMALKSGESKWITGEQSRLFAHRLRACHDATLVGKNTVLIDDPTLDIRHPDFVNRKNKVIVLDTKGEILKKKDLKIFKTHQKENIFVFTLDKEIQSDLATVISVEARSTPASNKMNLEMVMQRLWDLEIRSILVEGGGQVLSSFVQESLADRLYLFQAPVILGAISGLSWSQNIKISSMSEKIQLLQSEYIQFGPDSMLSFRFKQL